MAESPLRSEMVASLEKDLRDFAFTLALIEKAASTLGTMNFIWATVVLLGGFSQSLKSIDFWFVSLILGVEGLRIFCRGGELATRRSSPSNFSFITFLSNVSLSSFSLSNFIPKLIHVYSLVIQEYSAIACIVLSSLRIQDQQYGSDYNLNRERALNLFYWLSNVESSLTLFGYSARSLNLWQIFQYYRWLVLGERFSSVLSDNGFDNSMFERYFYDTYCRCINGSVFDALKVDFLSYSVELLQSIDDNEQLAGARLLSLLLKSDSLDSEKLRVIRTMPGVLERLIELLNWEKPEQKEIRTVAGQIICKLVQIPRHRIRVMAIPESLESITSLLGDPDQIVLGKQILKFLAEDPDNHDKIRTNRVLRHKIISLDRLDPNPLEPEIIQYLENMETETRTDQQDVGENSEGTSRVEAEHSDDPTSQSVDSQV